MKKVVLLLTSVSIFMLHSCSSKNGEFDATGTFETDEVIVSSELGGKILSFSIEEGNEIGKDSIVGLIDATNVTLQKEQAEATIQSLGDKTADVGPQVKLLRDFW